MTTDEALGRLHRWLQRSSLGRFCPHRALAAGVGLHLFTLAYYRARSLDGFVFSADAWAIAYVIAGILLFVVAVRPLLAFRAVAATFAVPVLIARAVELLFGGLPLLGFIRAGGGTTLLIAAFTAALLAYWHPPGHNGGA